MSRPPEPVPNEPGLDAVPDVRPPIKITQTRASYAWIGLVISIFAGIFLLIFILQNSETAQVDLLFWDLDVPLGVALLIASVLGALITAIVGGVRIVQIRRAAKRM